MELSAWISGRERAALRGVHLYGLCLCGALLAATAWLGWREARLAGLPEATRVETVAQEVVDARLRLKHPFIAVHVAKVTRNALLVDVIGCLGNEALCMQIDDLRNLPEDSPCFSGLRDALGKVFSASYGAGGPALDENLLRDPWGSPLMLNASEQSCGHFGAWCPEDTIRSAGVDGKYNTPDDIVHTLLPHLGPAAAAKAVK